jgi:hypothetical protein
MPETFNTELPLLVIVSVPVAVVLVTTFPNAKLPLREITRVGPTLVVTLIVPELPLVPPVLYALRR